MTGGTASLIDLAASTPKTCGCYRADVRDPRCEAEFPEICPWRSLDLALFAGCNLSGSVSIVVCDKAYTAEWTIKQTSRCMLVVSCRALRLSKITRYAADDPPGVLAAIILRELIGHDMGGRRPETEGAM